MRLIRFLTAQAKQKVVTLLPVGSEWDIMSRVMESVEQTGIQCAAFTPLGGDARHWVLAQPEGMMTWFTPYHVPR